MSVVGPAFIYSLCNKLFCLGHLETISLSCRRTIAFIGSNTRGISHVVMKYTYKFKSCFCSISIPQCTGCFWEETWASVLMLFDPVERWKAPSAWWDSGSWAWAYPEPPASFVGRWPESPASCSVLLLQNLGLINLQLDWLLLFPAALEF